MLLAGCGSQVGVLTGDPVASPYNGPMSLPATHDHPDVLMRSGAAGRALECEGEPANGATHEGGGVAGTARGALADLVDGPWTLPREGWRIEREEGSRVLFSFDVDGRTRAAVIVKDDVRSDYEDETGWAMESFATCDPSEWPHRTTDALGIGVWLDEDGERVPTSEIVSHAGPEHCEWDYMTFLVLNGDEHVDQGRLGFVEDERGEFAGVEEQVAAYDPDAELPPDAVDTGWHREGRHLWLAADESAAYLVGPDRTERWPASEAMCR